MERLPVLKRSFRKGKPAGSTGRKKGKYSGRIFQQGSGIHPWKKGYKNSLVSGRNPAFRNRKTEAAGKGGSRESPGKERKKQ